MAYDESEMRTRQKRIVTPGELQGVKTTSLTPNDQATDKTKSCPNQRHQALPAGRCYVDLVLVLIYIWLVLIYICFISIYFFVFFFFFFFASHF